MATPFRISTAPFGYDGARPRAYMSNGPCRLAPPADLPQRLIGSNMPVWRTAPVSSQPELSLRSWRIFELPNGDRHLVGYCTENQEGRVSTAIRTFDASALHATTATGRVYALHGSPGVDLDADYVWSRWARTNSVESWTDVTEPVWDEHVASAAVGTHNVKSPSSS